MHLQINFGRQTFELRLGRRVRSGIRGVVVDQHSADLAARLSVSLGTRVLLRPNGDDIVLHLLDAEGNPLRNHGGGPELDKRGRLLEAKWPIPVAIIAADPARWYGPELPVTIFLEPVPGTSVGMAGNQGASVADAATYIVRHYQAAIGRTMPQRK
jgi:hypothetical protein